MTLAATLVWASSALAQSGSAFDGPQPDRVSSSATDKDARTGLDRAERTVAGIEAYHVQGNVYLLVGAGANVAVQIGADGVLVVDTGSTATRDGVLAAIRKLSDGPIRWIVNTSADIDHTGGNETISQAGKTVNGNPAAIISHENVLARMTEANRPITEMPLNTFFEAGRDFYFNGEAVFLYHVPDAHTDGDIFVYFRGSDVVVSGDLFTTTEYPVIRLDQGGGVDGFVNGLNAILDVAVPKYLQEGGTYVIPGHGRVCDEADVLEYRDMVVIVRDRIASLVAEGKSLPQVIAAKPALDYDLRYGGGEREWNTAKFVEAVYRDVSEGPRQ
jgi:glyoxylase-like metal-dependent hydrolase (beta-lactamase superfamily II)